MRKVKKQKHENITDTNLQRVTDMLAPTNGQSPITKKEACAILNIAYNTTRLTRLLEDFEERKEYVAKRKSANRGKSATKGEINEAITGYLQGDSVAEIAKYLYRSPAFVKAIIDRVGVPARRTKEESRWPLLLPDPCVSEDFEVGEKVWCATYDAPAEVDSRLDDSYIDKYGVPCYKVYIFEKVNASETWFPGIETGGFTAYQPAYDLGKLSHLKEYGVNLEKV